MRPTLATTSSLTRKRWTLRGQLQGVGFRPFVYRLAKGLGLAGFVRNDSSCVTIEAQGSAEALAELIRRVQAERPELAEIADISELELSPISESGFEIDASLTDSQRQPVVTVDTAVCPDCVRELFEPSDFRFAYPLINCTNCGPRYSIIRAMPYDRANTTMHRFGLCEKCHQQYANPENRRFHAQPVACHDCGPRMGLYEFVSGMTSWDRAIPAAAELIRAGRIVAVKGIGGFHLACRADDERVVAELRRRKRRDAKPFAIMCADRDVARSLVRLGAPAEREMTGPAAAIVLAPTTPEAKRIAPSVTMGNHRLGVMVPYTPVHHLLFAALSGSVDALVMTSANLTDEPLVKDNDEAIEDLNGIADAILLHERDIERSIDDSVLIDMGAQEKPLPIRRARGYVPAVISIQHQKSESKTAPGLCVGGELKNTVAVVRDDEVILSHHLGDLKHARGYQYFRKTIEDMCGLFEVRPQWIAHDLHPAYLSTQWAGELAGKWGVQLIGVQHHHAHAAAVLAEHGVTEPALAIVCDGVGYGTDGTAWGGELLLLDGSTVKRLGHLRPIPLAGGDAAARDTRRCAAGVMWEIGHHIDGLFPDAMEATIVTGMLRTGRNVVRSSAAGRLFDAIASLLGVCHQNTHEAQAAMALESLAQTFAEKMRPQVAGLHTPTNGANGEIIIDLSPVALELKLRHEAGESTGRLAWEFHEVFAHLWADAALRASRTTGVKTIGLSGGVFCNEILTRRISELLGAQGLRVLRHEIVPANDGGIAFGQAAVARALINEGVVCA